MSSTFFFTISFYFIRLFHALAIYFAVTKVLFEKVRYMILQLENKTETNSTNSHCSV